MKAHESFRLLADFFEQHQEIEESGIEIKIPDTFPIFTIAEALTIARLPGVKKEYDDTYLDLRVQIPGLDFETRFYINRYRVCEAVKTEPVVIPAQAKHIVQKVTAWKCHPLLGLENLEK